MFQGLFVLTPAHGPREIELTVDALDHAASKYKQALDRGSVDQLLIGAAIKPVFRKYV